MLEMDFIRLLFSQKSGKTFFPIQVRCLIRTLYLSYFRKKLHLRCLKPISFMNYFRKKHHLRCLTRIQSNTYFCEKLQLRCLTRLHPFTVFVCVFVCACVYSSTVKASSVCKMPRTSLRVRINNLVL